MGLSKIFFSLCFLSLLLLLLLLFFFLFLLFIPFLVSSSSYNAAIINRKTPNLSCETVVKEENKNGEGGEEVHQQSSNYIRSVGEELRSSKKKRLLVFGVGGSGTHTLSILFQLLGLDIKHEDIGGCGSVSWPLAVGSFERKFVPYPDFMMRRLSRREAGRLFFKIHNGEEEDWRKSIFAHFFFVLRHPVKVISSM